MATAALPPLRYALMDYFASGGTFPSLTTGMIGCLTRTNAIKWLLQNTPNEGAIDDDAETDEVADFQSLKTAIRLVQSGSPVSAVFAAYIKPMLEEEDYPAVPVVWQKPADEEVDLDYDPAGEEEEDESSSTEDDETEEASSTEDEAETEEYATPPPTYALNPPPVLRRAVYADVIVISDDEDDAPPAKRRC